jgi:hypothetical protein
VIEIDSYGNTVVELNFSLSHPIRTVFVVLQEVSTRPPVYNPEDYAISLKKWTSNKAVQKNGDALDVSVPPSTIGESEMSLRQFLSVSDLLNKLKTDLRLAYLR